MRLEDLAGRGYMQSITTGEWRRSWAQLDAPTQWWTHRALYLVGLVLAVTLVVHLARWAFLRRRRAHMPGQVVLVTGGANGLGRELVRQLHALGARLVVWDVDAVGLQRLGKELKERVHTYQVDLTNRQSIYDVAKVVLKDVGRVDVVINNAGVVCGKTLLAASDDDIQRTFTVNTLALFWVAKAFLPAMKKRNSGHIVNIGSVLGLMGASRLTEYSASKFGVFGFTECLRMELKSEGSSVRTTLICPYHIDTGMFAGVKIPWYSNLFFPVLKQGEVGQRVVKAILLQEEVVFICSSFWLVFLLRMLPTALFDRTACIMGAFHGMRNFVGHVGTGKSSGQL